MSFSGGPLTLDEGLEAGVNTSLDLTKVTWGDAATLDIATGVLLTFNGDADASTELAKTIRGAGGVAIASSKVTLSGANTYTGGTQIGQGAIVKVGGAHALGTGKVTGDGNVVIADGTLLPRGAANTTALKPIRATFTEAASSAEDGWRGTVTLQGIHYSSIYANFKPLGNASSILEIDGFRGYFQGGITSEFAELRISKKTKIGSTSDYGLYVDNGNSGNEIAFVAPLTGDGPITMGVAKPTVALKLVGTTDRYTGNISLSMNFRLLFMSSASASTAGLLANAQISVARNDVKVNGTWSKTYVKDSIGGAGAISGTLTFADGATVDATDGVLTATTVTRTATNGSVDALKIRVPASAATSTTPYVALKGASGLSTENIAVYLGNGESTLDSPTITVADGNLTIQPTAVLVPTIRNDVAAQITGDPEAGFTLRPSDGITEVEVVIPSGVDAGKVTLELSPAVATVKPNGAHVKIVRGAYDITAFLDIPDADENGQVDLAKATVKEIYIKEPMNISTTGVVIELNVENPRFATPTRPGLTYTLREGTTLATMKDGASTIGDGNIWIPPVTVKGGTSGFYSIKVSK